MSYITIWLGEIFFRDFKPFDIHLDVIHKMKLTTKIEAIQQMYQDMISIFSSFGDGYAPESIDDIEVHQISFSELCSMSVKNRVIHIEPINSPNEFCNALGNAQLVGYGVSGGLHMAFASILIDVNVFFTLISQYITINDFSYYQEKNEIIKLLVKNDNINQSYAKVLNLFLL